MPLRIYEVPGVNEETKARIEHEVNKLPGVTGIVVGLWSRTVAVEGVAADHRIRAAIEKAGHPITRKMFDRRLTPTASRFP